MLALSRLLTISLAPLVTFAGLSAAQSGDQLFRFAIPQDYHVDRIIEDPVTHSLTILAHTEQQGGGRTDLVTVCDPKDRTVAIRNRALQTQDLWPLSIFGSCAALAQAMHEHIRAQGR